MGKIFQLEKFIFYALVFLLFVQARIIWYSFGSQFNEWTSVYFYATDILIIAVIFLWLGRERANFSYKKIIENFKKPLLFVLGVFLLVDFLSVWVADNFWLSLYGFVKLTEFAFLFLYLRFNFVRHYNLTKFWWIFIASASLQGVVALLQFFWQKSLGFRLLFESSLAANIAGVAKIEVAGQKIIRAYGLVPHPNILAAILILAIFGLAYLYINNYAKSKNWVKIILGVDLILIFSALFFTFSRSVAVIGFGFLFLCFFAIFWRQKESRRPAVIFFSSLLVIFSLLFVVYRPHVLARYDVAGITQSQAFSLRAFYAKTAVDFIKITPIWGVGQNNFVWDFSRPGYLQSWMYQPVHNIYLLIASETGLGGWLAFLLFLFFTIKGVWSSRRDLAIICHLSLVSCLLVFGLFDHFLWDLQQGQIIFWMFLGILASFISAHSSMDRAQASGA